jgi:hypothetical protein
LGGLRWIIGDGRQKFRKNSQAAHVILGLNKVIIKII